MESASSSRLAIACEFAARQAATCALAWMKKAYRLGAALAKSRRAF